MVVIRKITDCDQIQTGIRLALPMAQTQAGGQFLQLLFVAVAAPERFQRKLQFSVGAYARVTGDMS